MDSTERPQPPASLAQRAARTRWITPGTGLVVGLITAAIVVVRVARVEVERLHDALKELASQTTGLRSLWPVNQRLRRLMEEAARGS